MKNYKYIFLVVLTLIIANSCSKFEEINTNPNTAIPTSEMLATQVLKETFRFWNPNPTDFSFSNLYNKHMARLETNPNPNQYYYSYYPYGGWGYENLTNLKRMVEFSANSPYESSYKGLAKFMKAYYGFSATIEMGDVPYSEAGMAEEGIVRPKYDKQEDVFKAVLNDFKEAELLFAAGTNFRGDIMYNGDVTKWRKLSNAMQLKVLQTMSKKITPEQKTRFAAIVDANNLMTGNADVFRLVYTTNTNATHPFFEGESQRILNGVSKMVVDELKLLNDRRLFYFAEPAIYNINNGLLENDYAAYEGAPTELAADQLALNRQAKKYSLINKRYTMMRDGDPMLLFTYAEQCFIIAEAIEEGWVTGVSQTYYENGVKAMLTYYKGLPSSQTPYLHGMAITQPYIDTYFSGAAAFAATKNERLQQIWKQRWLIDFFQGNGGNYPQFLRTGYPVYPLDPATSMNPDDPNVYPKRWKYPPSELNTNPDNYLNAIQTQYGGYDGINETPWYLQN